MKFVLQRVTAGKFISLIGPKFVSTLILVGLDLYRARKVPMRTLAQIKQTAGPMTQKARMVRLLLGSLVCFKPEINFHE